MTNLYVANVIGENLIDEDLPVETNPAPRLVGDEGVLVQYGDRATGVTLSVLADDEEDAERMIVAAFGPDAYIDELTLSAPVPPAIARGLRNLAHAARPCDDPDCEIHNPEVIEGTERLTAMAWFEAGKREVLDDLRPDGG